MARSKNLIGAVVAAGLGSAALAVVLVTASGIGERPATASSTAAASQAVPTKFVDLPSNPLGVGLAENVWNATVFADVFRATHIARGYVIACDYPTNNVVIKFQPTEYIKGSPLAMPVVDLITGGNADLTFAVGQEAVCSWVVREDGAMGLAHSVNSMTPAARGWNPQATVDLMKAVMAINEEAGTDLNVVFDGKPENNRFVAPMWVREAWVDVLVDALGVPSSMAAYHAGMELDKNPVFQGMLKPQHLERIAGFALRSHPATHDRGYHFILMRKYNHNSVASADVVSLIRDERANVVIDHMGAYLATQRDEAEVADALAPILVNRTGVAASVRANAMIAAAASGNRRVLPVLRTLLGHETDARCKKELLNTLRALPAPENLMPLVNYLNGGDASRDSGVNWDSRNSMHLHKRTLLAISAIDSPDSNAFLQQAYNRTRVIELKRFIRPLLEANKEWRAMVEVLDAEQDLSLFDLDKHYKAKGIYE